MSRCRKYLIYRKVQIFDYAISKNRVNSDLTILLGINPVKNDVKKEKSYVSIAFKSDQ